LTDLETRESFGRMRTRLATAALAAVTALALATVPAVSAAPAQGERATADASAKRCKKGRAVHKGRCVKRCPRGYAKKRKRGARRCVKLPGGGGPGTGQPPGDTAPPQSGPAPNPNQVQLVRDDAAGQAAVSGDLLLERASFGSSGRTAEYTRISMYGSGQFRLSVRDWNDVSGEIPRSCSDGTWVFKEGYTYSEQGGGVVVKITTTTQNGSGDDVLVFHSGEPDAVYLLSNGQLVRFDKNPQMNQGC
jgi:hypothetical protein